MIENSEEVNIEKDYNILLFRELREVKFSWNRSPNNNDNNKMVIENIGEELSWKVRESQ